MHIQWQWKTFKALINTELYALLKLRAEVFVVEQQCAYLDVDNLDQQSLHLLGWHEQQLAAYLRIIMTQSAWKIGRVVTAPAYRGQQLGRALMQQAMEKITADAPAGIAVILAAQAQRQSFYKSFGFTPCSEPYDEDGILHIDMTWQERK